VLANAIANQVALVDQAFTYTVPSTAFTDADSDTLTFSAALGDGSALPSWLTFTASTRQFSGTPTAAATITVKVTAADDSLDTAEDTFTLESISAFSVADFEGVWYEHEIGNSADSRWWNYMTFTTDSAGLATVSDRLNLAGETTPIPDFTWSISNKGISSDSTFHSIMSLDKDFSVATMTQDDGLALSILQKGGGTFVLSDLAGSWFEHELGVSGNSSWWNYATFEFTSNGVATVLDRLNNSGETSTFNAGTFSIGSNGIISIGNDHFATSLDKSLLVGTMTQSDGAALVILQKGGGSFLQSDLEGTWYVHELGVGEDSTWWNYMTFTIDENGLTTVSDRLNNSGETTPIASFTFSIASNGVISVGADHGAMSLDKRLIVMTMTQSDGLALAVLVKGVP